MFSITQRVRRRHEVFEASDVRLWKWMADDILAIVTKTVGVVGVARAGAVLAPPHAPGRA